MTRLDRWLWALLAALALTMTATTSQAGCGCDHPPPAYAPVMPAFGYAGSPVTLHLESASLEKGASYWVEFTNALMPIPLFERGEAFVSDSVAVDTPRSILTGPTRIRIMNDDMEVLAEFDDSMFTGLPLPRLIPAGDSVVLVEDFYAAVSRDGVLYIAVDLQDVLDGAQFAFVMPDVPVEFDAQDVVFFNKDGVDLTLFTLAVADPTERQWGSYYGWDVEQDAGIVGTVYETKVGKSPAPGEQSDMLTYWRHEFHSYAAAHAPGRAHEVNEFGYHKNGTRHVDHDLLVIAIRGKNAGEGLEPGGLRADLVVTKVGSEGPIEPETMAEAAFGSALYVEDNAAFAGWIAGLMGADSVSPDPDGVVGEEPEPTTDLEITKARYTKKGRIKVWATSRDAGLTPTVSIQGFVTNAPMVWDPSDERYEYSVKSQDDLTGRLAVVRDPNGASVSAVID